MMFNICVVFLVFGWWYYRSYRLGPLQRWRQPLKAGIAVAITSVYVLHHDANHALGG